MCAVLALGSNAALAVPAVFDFVEPAGWSVGSPLSTSAGWAAGGSTSTPIGRLTTSLPSNPGTPNVYYDDAGGSLASPVLTGVSPAFIASSGGYYSFGGNYTVNAVVSNHTTAPATGAGTHVIVQAFTTLNPDFVSGSIFSPTITDTSNNAISGAQLLRSDKYGLDPDFPLFGGVSAEAYIFEYWLPEYVGDFKAGFGVAVHGSLQAVQVDTKIADAVDGDSPFAITAVPEPATAAMLALGGTGLLFRRRRQTLN